jgi:hypothetical protein
MTAFPKFRLSAAIAARMSFHQIQQILVDQARHLMRLQALDHYNHLDQILEFFS